MITEQIRNEKVILSEIKALNERRDRTGKEVYELIQDLSALERQIEQVQKTLDMRKNTLDFLTEEKRKRWREIDELPFELTEFGMGVDDL